ncbi:hypothetical protein ACFVVU_26660 [Kitasatospora sp. NPDC057965]|uniref:nSTAND1 domain-containing NTPase n=1 Tax=Kitasatospora sp. NPDC057965 TaxID=3346291 RepID=UPI0036DF51A1
MLDGELRGVYENRRTTVASYLREWLATRKPYLAPNTYAGYAACVERDLIPAFGHLRLLDLRPEHVDAWVSAQLEAKRGRVTVYRAVSTLRNALNAAVRSWPADESRTKTLTALTSLARAILVAPASGAVLVLVMRDDFYPRMSALAAELLQVVLDARGVLNVPAALTGAELAEIVTGPASDLETDFEAGLPQRIVSDVLDLAPHTAVGFEAPVTVLPLLEVALSRLWESRLDHDGRLTHDAYRRIGAVTGALAGWCDTALRELDEQQQRIAQRALTALVRPADQALNIPAARQQLSLGELRELAADDDTPQALEAVDEVLTVLSRHRVITTDRTHEPGPASAAAGTPMAELIHDALIRDWPALRRWMEQDAHLYDWLHRTRAQHTRWQKHHNPQDLPAGTLLAEGMDLARRSRRLPAELAAFLEAGRRRQQAAARRGRLLKAVLAALLVFALAASGVLFRQLQAAVTAEEVAESRRLAAMSTALLDINPDVASLSAVVAYRTKRTLEAATALSAAAVFPLHHRFIGHTTPVTSVAFSGDGRTLATASWDAVLLWNVATGESTAASGHINPVTSVAFSRDGGTLAIASDDSTVRLWDVATHQNTATLTGHTSRVTSVAFSPDGRTLATASWDRTARLWSPTAPSTLAIAICKDLDRKEATSLEPADHPVCPPGFVRDS